MRADNSLQKTIVTFMVSECSEFHGYGEVYEDIATMEEEKALYERIDPARLHAIPAIGIKMHREGTADYEDVEMDFYSGGRIDLEMLEYLPDFVQCKEAMAALYQLMEAFPDAKVIGKFPDGVERDKKKQHHIYGADVFEFFRGQKVDKTDRENDQQKSSMKDIHSKHR